MSNFLAVDTSSKYLTVVAKNGDNTAVTHMDECAMKHSVLLMDAIDKTLEKAKMSISDCDYFVAVTGPGSFTGIRIGISCVKGFSVATGKKAVGVTSFNLISYNVVSNVPYLVAIDAMHSRYYVCGYDSCGKENIAPAYLSKGELIALNRPIYGFEQLNLPGYTRVEISGCLQKAAEMCEKGEGLYALYVRKSQAEEERISRLGKL